MLPHISNPDLAERFRNGRPLAGEADPSTWYSGTKTAEGYTDYPLDEATVEAGAGQSS